MLTKNNIIASIGDVAAPIVLMTDLEPDDVLAIKLLATYISLDTPMCVVVGEGSRPFDKQVLTSAIFAKYGFRNVMFQHSGESNKDYPQRCIDSYSTNIIPAKIVENPWYDHRKVYTLESIMAEFVNMNVNVSPTLIALKPMRELLDIPRSILMNYNAYIYGSFNFRSLSNMISREALANFVNTSFKSVLLYESFFASGANNTMTAESHPELFAMVDSDPELTELMNGWNEFIVRDCLDTVIELSGKLNEEFAKRTPDRKFISDTMDRLVNRNLKVVVSIDESHGKQMVYADQGLIQAIFARDQKNKEYAGDISFDERNYTKLAPVENLDSKVRTIIF